MIVQEDLFIDDRRLIKTYSDNGKYIMQNETGIKYAEAVDITNKYTYTESKEDLPKENFPLEREVKDVV